MKELGAGRNLEETPQVAARMAREIIGIFSRLQNSDYVAGGSFMKTDTTISSGNPNRHRELPANFERRLTSKIITHLSKRGDKKYSLENSFSIALALFHRWTFFERPAFSNLWGRFETNGLEHWMKRNSLSQLLEVEERQALAHREEILGTLHTSADGKWGTYILFYPTSLEKEGDRMNMCLRDVRKIGAPHAYLELTRRSDASLGRRVMILSIRAEKDVFLGDTVIKRGESVQTLTYDPETATILEAEGPAKIISNPRRTHKTFLRQKDPWFPYFLELVRTMRTGSALPDTDIESIDHLIHIHLKDRKIAGMPLDGAPCLADICKPNEVLLDTGEEIPLAKIFPVTQENLALGRRVIAGGRIDMSTLDHPLSPQEYAKLVSKFPVTADFSQIRGDQSDSWQPYRDALTVVKGSISDALLYGEFPNLRHVGDVFQSNAFLLHLPRLEYVGRCIVAPNARRIEAPSLPETLRISLPKDTIFSGPMREAHPERFLYYQ